MTAAVKTLTPARPVGKEFLLSTNIPFLDSSPDAFSTSFQEDFKPFSSKKEKPVSQPIPAQVDHKDLRYIKENLTETMVSYKPHPLPKRMSIPRWTRLSTNFKMQTDPREVAFLTIHSQQFPLQPFQPLRFPIQQTLAIMKTKQMEKLPESTTKASFTPQHGSPVVKATVKHLEEGFPTIKGDGRLRRFVSQYNDSFQGTWSRAALSVTKHTSSVVMGDPGKIAERETTHAASFNRPAGCRPPVVRERLKINLGDFSKDSWLSTSREAFCCHKLASPVVPAKRNQNSSSLPRGDTDTRRNKERMSVTTNNISFSDLNHTERPVHVPGHDLMTRSNVKFSPASLSGLYYTTTAKEHYSKQGGERARPVIHLPNNILTGPDHGLSLSITKTDYVPFRSRKQTPCVSQQMSHIRLPLTHQQLSTTHREEFTAKPLILQPPSCSQLFTHFILR